MTSSGLRIRKRQTGAAIMVILMIAASASAYMIADALNQASRRNDRGQVTADALAQAKAALISFAASVDVASGGITANEPRPGDLPCPDTDNNGLFGTNANAPFTNCNTPNTRLGRLPWQSLNLEDLRDGDGERLWYAVSNSYKNNPRLPCGAPGTAVGCLHSDTVGTITVRDAGGTVVSNAATGTDVVAVIIAPGAAIRRQDGVQQNRTLANVNTAAHYLDNVNGIEDNANFIDGSATNGFISGPVRNAGNEIILNDKLLTITRNELMAAIEARVARLALGCLTGYAAANGNRYPWAAPVTPGQAPTYVDTNNTFFGRFPNTGFVNAGTGMNTAWNCPVALGWFNNWRERIFYTFGGARRPTLPAGNNCGAAPNTCLTVNTPASVQNQFVAVFVAGRRLPGIAGGQPRAAATPDPRGTIGNYLENQNQATRTFTQGAATNTFNDKVVFSQ